MKRAYFLAMVLVIVIVFTITSSALITAEEDDVDQIFLPLVMQGTGPIEPPLDAQTSVLPTSGPPGTLVHMRGSGFDETPCGVDFYWDSPDGLRLGFTTLEEGNFTADLTIPESAGGGRHLIIAQGLLSDQEFCGGPSSDKAEALFMVTEATPLIIFEAADAVQGSVVTVSGSHFCNNPACSDITIFFGGRIGAQNVKVGNNGTFKSEAIIPGGYPIGDMPVIARQVDGSGNELIAYGELQIWTRPNVVEDGPNNTRSATAVTPAGLTPVEKINDSGEGSRTGSAGGSWPTTGPGKTTRNALFSLFMVGMASAVLLWSARGPALRRRNAWQAGGVIVLVLMALILIGVPGDTRAAAPSAMTDVNPDGLPGEPRYGGRVLGVTISPTNNQLAYAASELGGIFRSNNGGGNWVHIDDVPLTISRDVMFDPQDANTVIASGFYDGQVVNQGGIWRSTNGGATWTKPATSNPGCSTQASTWGIAIANDAILHTNIYVGTDCGLAISADSGATWNHVDPCTSTDAAFCNAGGTIFDVEARVVGGQVQLDACGVEGYFRSPDGGATWSAPDAASPVLTGLNNSPCSVATAPNDANTVYVAHFSGLTPPPGPQFCVSQLLESTTGGTAGSWVDMLVSANNCRDAWVVTHPALDGDANHFEVYYGDSQRVHRQHCDAANAPRCATGVANWPNADSGAHADPSDIAFNTSTVNGCPQILSTDGGISTSSDCGATWVDGNRGLHALDIRGLAGTVEAGHTDLYVGAQDNGLYFSQDGAVTWSRPVGADVYNVYADHNSPADVLYRQCFGCGDVLAGAHLAGAGGFSDPPGNIPVTAVAAQFGPDSYIFLTNDGGTPALWTVYVTTDSGGTWNQMGPSPLPGNPGEVKASGSAATPTFYLRLNVGGQLRIYSLTGALDNTASLTLVSSGLNTPTGAWGVDPSDPNLLYVTDIGTNQMMFTTDGGGQWDPDPALTNLVTRGGVYRFNPNMGAMPRAVAYDQNSDMIMVGTRTSGLFASVTGGEAWFSIRGAEGLPLYLDFFFDESNGSVYAATRGRGIWMIDVPLANLSITKSDAPDPVIAGEKLWYDIAVHNSGPDEATGVVVLDTLPLGVTYDTDTDACTLSSGTGPGGEDQLTCELGDLPAGASSSFTIQVTVDSNLVAAAGGPTTITNVAEVSSTEQGDVDLSDNTAKAVTIVNDLADVRVAKDCKPERELLAGEQGTCTIVVENLGPSTARNVVVTDSYVSDGDFFFGTVTPGTCVVTPNPQSGSGSVTCSLGDMAVGSRVTIAIKIWANAPVDINDRVVATSDTPDPNLANNVDTDTISVKAAADLSLTKMASPDPVVAGTTLTYELEVTNNGPSAATNVEIVDVLPSGVTIDSVLAAPAGSCKAGVPGNAAIPTKCALGTIVDGGSATMTIVVTVLPGTSGLLHNNGMVSSDVADPNNSNNLATTRTAVEAQADLVISKTDSPDPVVAGGLLSYEVTIRNDGPSTAIDTELTDSLPAEVTFIQATVSNGAGTCVLLEVPPNTVSCDLNDLNPAEFVSVIILVRVKPSVPDGATISNTATVSSVASDPNPGNSSATQDTLVFTEADLEVLKEGQIDTSNPSLTVIYMIDTINHGPSDAEDVVMVDSLPLDYKKVEYQFDTGNGACSYEQTAHQLTCDFGKVKAGETVSIKIYVKIKGSVGVISNYADVTTSSSDPDLTNNTARKDLRIHG